MACLVSRTGRELQRYDNLGRRQVVGCIPYRFKNCLDGSPGVELEILLISSQKDNAGMMFPKGGWELDETVEQAAARESVEEAGVLGVVEGELGTWNFLSKRFGSCYEGYMFPLHVKQELELWPEKELRRRIWMNVDDARVSCRHAWMVEALDKLVERIAGQNEASC